MLLSEILKYTKDEDVIDLIKEKEFVRFARTTSVITGSVCVYVNSEQYLKTIPVNASMVITSPTIAKLLTGQDYGICISKNPKASYFRAFIGSNKYNVKSNSVCTIGENSLIGNMVSIADKNVTIGRNVIIEDFVTIYENVTIGDNCIIRSGVRLGVQDYNYFLDQDSYIHLPHYGELVIEDNVEIGFNSVIGKSLYPGDVTLIGKGTKIANNCGIGHDCKIGENVLIYAGTMVAGYVEIGDGTHVTLNSSLKNGIKIGKNVTVDMGSVVIRDIPDDQTVFGNPARRVITPN